MTAPDVRLEPLEPRHAALLFDGLRDPALYEFVDDAPPASVDALRARYERLATRRSPDGAQVWLNWAVWSQATQRHAGYVQATVERTGVAELAYVLFAAHQGRGLARAAVAGMIERLRQEHGVTSLRARVDGRHRRSRALLEALGFAAVGTEPAELRGEPVEDVVYVRVDSSG